MTAKLVQLFVRQNIFPTSKCIFDEVCLPFHSTHIDSRYKNLPPGRLVHEDLSQQFEKFSAQINATNFIEISVVFLFYYPIFSIFTDGREESLHCICRCQYRKMCCNVREVS